MRRPLNAAARRLSRRLSLYAAQFPQWKDLARQTPKSLLELPKIGATAVEALIDAAGEAVRVTREVRAAGPAGANAAATRLLVQLSDYVRTILAGRGWTLEAMTLQTVAGQLGASVTSVQRNLPRAHDRVRGLLAEPAHQEVVEHATMLQRAIAPCVPMGAARLELCRLGVDPAGQTAAFLLHVAGPYALRGHWLESAHEAGGIRCVQAALADIVGRDHAPSTKQLLECWLGEACRAASRSRSCTGTATYGVSATCGFRGRNPVLPTKLKPQ